MRSFHLLVLMSLSSCCLLLASQASAVTQDDLWALSLEDLMQVEIQTAGKRAEKISDIPASVDIVTRKDIATYGYTSLTDILENITGLYNIYGYDDVSGNIGIRGLWNPRDQNSSVAVLVNGISQARVDNRSNPFSKINIPVEAIDRIEVIRGPMSVIYGNGAFFGVINIVTNEQSGRGELSLHGGYGSHNTARVSGRYQSQNKTRPLVVNFGTERTDGLDYPIRDMASDENLATLPAVGVSDPSTYTFDGFLEQERHYVDMSTLWGQWFFDGSYNHSEIERFVLLPSLDEGSRRRTKNLSLRLGYDLSIGDGHSLRTTALYNKFDQDQNFDAIFVGIEGVNTVEYEAYDIESVLDVELGNVFGLVAGINYQYLSNFYEFTNVPAAGFINESVDINKRETSSVFVQGTYHVSDTLSAVLGYRFESISKHDRMGIEDGGTPQESQFGGEQGGQDTSTPRIALVYAPKKHHTVKVMYGEANKIANDRFDPEESNTFEINYLYVNDATRISASVFQNGLEELIVETLDFNQDGSVSNRTIQGGAIDTRGVELDMTFSLSEHCSTAWGYAYQSSEDKLQESVDLAYSPTSVFHGKLNYQQNNFVVSLLGRYVDDIHSFYDVAMDNSDGSFGGRIGESADAYFVVDANIRVTKLFKHAYLNVKFSNIFDEEVRYPNNPFNSEILDRGTIGPDRGFMVSVGWER